MHTTISDKCVGKTIPHTLRSTPCVSTASIFEGKTMPRILVITTYLMVPVEPAYIYIYIYIYLTGYAHCRRPL